MSSDLYRIPNWEAHLLCLRDLSPLKSETCVMVPPRLRSTLSVQASQAMRQPITDQQYKPKDSLKTINFWSWEVGFRLVNRKLPKVILSILPSEFGEANRTVGLIRRIGTHPTRNGIHVPFDEILHHGNLRTHSTSWHPSNQKWNTCSLR